MQADFPFTQLVLFSVYTTNFTDYAFIIKQTGHKLAYILYKRKQRLWKRKNRRAAADTYRINTHSIFLSSAAVLLCLCLFLWVWIYLCIFLLFFLYLYMTISGHCPDNVRQTKNLPKKSCLQHPNWQKRSNKKAVSPQRRAHSIPPSTATRRGHRRTLKSFIWKKREGSCKTKRPQR